MTNIVLGADHNGIELKKIIKEYLLEKKFNPIDIGPFNTDKVDYTSYFISIWSLKSHILEHLY